MTSSRLGLHAQHQALAAAHEDPQRAVVGLDGGHLHMLAQLRDQAVALVQQVVGRLPRPRAAAIVAVDLGDAGGQRVDRVTAACSSWLTVVCSTPAARRLSLKRAPCPAPAPAPRRAWRRRPAGWPGRTSAANRLVIDAPMPCSPGLNTSPAAQPGARTASIAGQRLGVAASLVRKASCMRSTPTTSTPRPKKPTPVNCPRAVARSTLLARIALDAGVGDVVAGGLHLRVAGAIARTPIDISRCCPWFRTPLRQASAGAAGAAWC
jgi:hypothetical protein